MPFYVMFFISVILMIITIVGAVIYRIRKHCGYSAVINILIIGTFFSILLVLLPVYADDFSHWYEVAASAIVNDLQIFTINEDITGILADTSEKIADVGHFFQIAYISLIALLSVFAPILTAGFLLSIFPKISVHFRYRVEFKKDIYAFSELNERSLALASDIRNHHNDAMIIFTDFIEKQEEKYDDLAYSAQSINSLIFRNDIQRINLNHHSKKAEVNFFIIGSDETENITQALNLVRKNESRENTGLYLFSSSKESELALSQMSSKDSKIKVRRINEVQSLIYQTLYESGTKIFEKASEWHKEQKKPDNKAADIHAVIVGMGNYGTEMLKALTWYCQMDGFRFNMDIFDIRNDAEDRLRLQCPDLLSPKYNNKIYEKGESYYNITVHSGIDVNTARFANELHKLGQVTYVFISIGSDEDNIKTAAYIRSLFLKQNPDFKFKPAIQVVVRNTQAANLLKNAATYRYNEENKNEKYDWDFIGNNSQIYSEDIVMKSKLEEDGLKRHLRWGPEETFWAYEYNYRSSIASAIHIYANYSCKISGTEILMNNMDKKPDEIKPLLTDEQFETLTCLEHRRWNAYMRAEGYTHGEIRCDLAKVHPLLVNYYSLSPEDKYKDI